MLAFLQPPSCLLCGIVQPMLLPQVTHNPSPATRFFISNETHYMDTCGLPFPLGGGLRDGGAAALPAFNRDALTNRPRISLLDKVSFILTLHVPQRLCMEIKRAGESKFLGGCEGENSWHTVPGCALFDHAWALCMYTHNTHTYPEAGSFPNFWLETVLHISHSNHIRWL